MLTSLRGVLAFPTMLALAPISQAFNVGVETTAKHVNPIYTLFKYKENDHQVGFPGAPSVNQSSGKNL